MAFDSDLSKEISVVNLITPKSVTGNTVPPVLDLSQYLGIVAVAVSFGTLTAGDANSTLVYNFQTSATNNVSNAVNLASPPGSGTSVTASANGNNSASVAIAKIDTRAALQYLFAVPTIGGANSPAFPVSAVLIGQKAQMP